MHVAETFGRDERRKRASSRLAGRLAAHSLSARSSRDRPAATATTAAILGPTHLTLIGKRINRQKLFRSPHTLLPFLGVLTCWDFRTPCVTAYLRRGYPRTALPASALRTSLTLCAWSLRAISARA